MRWRDKDVRFSFLEDMTWHPIVTDVTSTPIGDLHFMAELELSGRTLICRQVHVQGPGANEVGIGNLMVLAQALMREMDFDGLYIEGAVRTTGTSPGNRTSYLRFTRRDRL